MGEPEPELERLRRENEELRRRLELSVRVEANLAFLAELDDAFAPEAGERAVARIAAAHITRHFGTTRVNFSDVSPAADEITVFFSQHDEGLKDDHITHKLSEYLDDGIIRDLCAGRTVAVDDVRKDPRTASRAEAYVQWDIGSLMLAPYVSEGRWRFVIVLHKAVPYAWRPDEVELLREVSARVHLRIARARSDAALAHAAERAELAQRAALASLYEVWPETGLVIRNQTIEWVTGYTPEELGRTVAAWRELIHPDDRASIERQFARGLRAGGTLTLEYRIRHKAGHYVWLSEQSRLVRDASGAVERVVGMVIDITERKRASEALREADQRKDEFLAMLGHELRNPLAPILNAVHILRAMGPREPALDRARDMIERQVGHLVRIVDDLLDVSRVSRGKVTLKTELLDLGSVIRHAVESCRTLFEARHHALVVSLPAEPVRLHGDFTRLAQVVSNLLNNAAKYTDVGGHVDVTLECAAVDGGREAVLRVRDDGRGIDPALLDSVFDLFFQADRNLDRAEGGMGIGLSLVRSLVELHGGRVEAHSAGRGRGTEIVVHLPCLAEVGLEPSPGAPQPERNFERRRVLVVDDNRDSAESMAALIELDGHEVVMAHDGDAAVAVALAERPEVVLLDIGLPKRDGYDVCRALRDAGLRDVLIIAMTGYGQEEDRQRSRDAGFDAHQIKPVDPAHIRRILADRSLARPSTARGADRHVR